MGYKNILWIKLEKRLLNDPRFYLMPAETQLTYLKLLMAAGHFSNRIPISVSILLTILRDPRSGECLEKDLAIIKKNFPKFMSTKEYYYFREFKKKHNQITPRISQEYAQPTVDKIRIDKIREEYIRQKKWKGSSLNAGDFARICTAAKKLLISAKDDEIACEAIRWVNENATKQGWNWTLETVVKKMPDFLNKPLPKPIPPQRHELGAMDNNGKWKNQHLLDEYQRKLKEWEEATSERGR